MKMMMMVMKVLMMLIVMVMVMMMIVMMMTATMTMAITMMMLTVMRSFAAYMFVESVGVHQEIDNCSLETMITQRQPILVGVLAADDGICIITRLRTNVE